MTDAGARILSPLKAYFLSPPLVLLATWGLLLLQSYVTHLEGGHVRPFGMGFLLVVALMTILGGRGPGLLTLLLSVLSITFYLTPLGSGGVVGRPRDWAELILLVCVGATLIRGLESLHKNSLLLAESEESRARLRAVMDTAPVGVLISELTGKLIYANREAEQILGETVEMGSASRWSRVKLLDTDGTHIPPEQSDLARALAGEAPVVYAERIIERPDGVHVNIQSNSTVVRDGTGRSLSGLIVFSDITERKRVEQEIARLLAREQLINRIGQISLQTQDPQLIQTEATVGLTQLLGADRVFFRLHDGDAALYTPGQTLAVADAADPEIVPLLREFLAEENLSAAITTPLFDGDRLVATLNVTMTDAPRSWTPEEVALVEAVTAQTRTAIESARTQTRERMIATALQEALIPEIPTHMPGLEMSSYYKAALDEANVGGDFLDVFALKNGQIIFTVGDLSGKGLAAAAQVATVRNMLRYSLYRTERLDQAISELNSTLVTHDLLTGFATLFVCIYDQTSHRLTYLSCGHDPSLLRRADTGAIELLPPVGTAVSPVLGLAENGVFIQETAVLSPGDTLFFCTDGVTEAGRSRGEFLGIAGVAKMLAAGPAQETAEELTARMIAQVREYAQGVLHDDVCLLTAIVGV